MVYRLDELTENKINPITKCEYDSSWGILMLTDSKDYEQINVWRQQWLCLHHKGQSFPVQRLENGSYDGHKYNESFLRENEPSILIHSTPMANWKLIKRDGMLKSWNQLKAEKSVVEEQPIGRKLGDPPDFCDYIMFGGGITGEIVVNSKQQGKIVMDENAEYLTGARLYFDAKRMARDGVLVRDGCHVKVKDTLPLKPYLIWAATWDTIGLPSQTSTPKIFARQADKQFQIIAHYNSLIDENNGPVYDPKPLRDYMDRWDGQGFIDNMELDGTKSVLL